MVVRELLHNDPTSEGPDCLIDELVDEGLLENDRDSTTRYHFNLQPLNLFLAKRGIHFVDRLGLY